jgi:tetratricopeptide (TPR) repeat protein
MMNESELGWLIRDNLNTIRGPFNHSEVLQLLKKGQLKSKTEISRANSYWFAVEEKAEVARFFPELGIKVDEQPTQMTSTLTQADISGEHAEPTEITTVTPTPPITREGDNPSGGAGQIQWLNDEFAEDFGEALTVQTRTGLNTNKNEKTPASLDPADSPANTDSAKNDLLKRSTVKADTLPSERKGFTGDRPKPINAVIKGGEKAGSGLQSKASNIVNVPVETPDSQATILPSDDTGRSNRKPVNKVVLGVGIFLGLLVIGAISIALVLSNSESKRDSGAAARKSQLPAGEAIRKSLLFFHLEGAKEALADLELESGSKGKSLFPMAQALVKKEFLYDGDGAVMALQTAKTLADSRESEVEVDNLLAIYRFERDREGSVELFKRNVQSFPADPIFRYNLALAQLRVGAPGEAIQTLSIVTGALNRDDPLMEDAGVLLGWAKEVFSKGNDPTAEAAYSKVLEANPNSAKARLGLAIYRLRKNGIREADSDFRAVLDNLPDLDPPTRIMNYRKMNDSDFYSFARTQLRELNVPGGAAGNKPSPLATAVDALLSCIQSRMGEAGKMLDLALSAAPGDPNILKAVGYHRYKDGKFAEIIDLLKDVNKERNSFGLNLLIAKSYSKIGKKDLAEKHLENLVTANPTRSDGWSLLGEMQLESNRPEEAKKSFQNALKKDPLDLVALRGLDRLGIRDVWKFDTSRYLPF